MLTLLFGKDGGLSHGKLKELSYRQPFSDYLPYLAYEDGLYLNVDETVGFIWECNPLCFLGDKSSTILEGTVSTPLPEGSIMQFILYADPNIDPHISAYRLMKKRDDPLVRKATESFTHFLKEGTHGVSKASDIPFRNFRLFFTVKMPAGPAGKVEGDLQLSEIRSSFEEKLRGAYLFPRLMEPPMLLDTLRRIFNAYIPRDNTVWNDDLPLRKQIINAETAITVKMRHLDIGDNRFRCITPKTFPKEVTALLSNILTGGIWGMETDADQIRTPFLYAMNIIVKSNKTALHTKCNLVLQQKGVGSLAPSLERKQQEYIWAVDEIEKGTKFLSIMPIFWVWGRDKDVTESISRAKRMWEGKSFIMQEDRGILPILFVSALPFGLYNKGRNIDSIERDFIAPINTIATILPVQADFAGGGGPAIVTMGRKGQICTLDIFDKGAQNHNFMIAGTTGGGKSFLGNNLAYNYYANGGVLRIVDIGFSYEKLCRLLGGRFLDFSKDSNICLNPFTFINDIDDEISIIAAIVMQMIYSSTNRIPEGVAETASNIVKAAVKWAWKVEGNDASIDTVHAFLNEFQKHGAELGLDCDEKEHCNENFTLLAHTLAFNLSEFTSDGSFGRWFNGKSNFDISSDEFVVLELDKLKHMRELFKVITFQVINATTRDLYGSTRDRPRMVLFEEAWQFMQAAQNGENDILMTVIEEGYRKARKYLGSFSVVTQSILDLESFGRVGKVIRGNSAFKFFLESNDFELAHKSGLIDYDDFTRKLLKSTKSNKPNYSEIFIDTPYGKGIMRLLVDPYNYYIATSDPRDNRHIEDLHRQGMSYADAIEALTRKRTAER